MDAADPRVDYLLIDDWINGGEALKVIDYCNKTKCNIKDVFRIWFDATCSDGIMISGHYFYKYRIDIEVEVLNFGNNSIKIPGHQRIQMAAISKFHPFKCGYDIDDYNGSEIWSRDHEGRGFVTQYKSVDIIDEYEVIVEVDYWKPKSIGMKW